MPGDTKPRRGTRRIMERAAPRKVPAAVASTGAILSAADLRKILLSLADQMAPGDVAELLAHEKQLRARCRGLTSPHLALFRDQITLAIDCLRDHARGRSPQIPYFTVSLLAAALWYFVDELDAVPDFLPRVGQLDDAVVLAMAFQLGEAGLRRYCDWKGRVADPLFGAAAAARLRRTATVPRRSTVS